MKKILSIFGTMALTTTASASVIACDKNGEKEKPISPVTPSKLIQINLSDLPGTLDIELKITKKTADDFKTALIAKLVKKQLFTSLTANDIEITKFNGNSLLDSDIGTNNDLKIKIKATSKSENFTSSKDKIIVNLTITKIDISNEIPSTINLGQLSENTATEFLNKLHEKLREIPDLSTITTNDYNVYNNNGTVVVIWDGDFIFDDSIVIKITTKKGTNFQGKKEKITVKYTRKAKN